MFELTRLKVQGFRGFVGEREFQFDEPVVILVGQNRRGKSSTLNAVEWCLFGDDCIGRKTGIRERLAWEVSNRYLGNGRVAVEAEFKSPEGTCIVAREMSGTGKGGRGTVTVTLPDGTRLQGEEAERRLKALFRSSFRDFMTTVYQHQEAIRAILTDEPRQRNDAIDRLLGLSEYRELLTGIRAAEVDKAQKAIESEFDHLRTRAEQSIRTYDNLIREEKDRAIAEGMREEDLTEEEALRRARDVGEAVRSLARDLEMGHLEVAVPAGYQEIAQFREWVKRQTDDLWINAPDVGKQEELSRERQKLADLKVGYETAKASEAETQQRRDTFVREHGDERGLEDGIAGERAEVSRIEARIREANKRARLVREAIDCLRGAAPGISTDRCPLCSSKVPNLLAHLESEWEEKLKGEVGELENQRQEHAARMERLQSLRRQLAQLDKELDEARSNVATRVRQVASVLGREIGKEDDPGALLNARLTEIGSELKRLGQAIEEKREKISGKGGIYDQLAKLRTIDDILNYERKRTIVERIWETPEFAELNEIRDEAARLVEDVQAITRCLAAASREEAQDKIRAAETALDENFRRLTNHPAIPGLVMMVSEDTRSGLNSYAFRSKDGSDPTPILSQGDLNCLALSLFLGLARATADTQPFAFLMLDDPAQSLGSEAKRQLVNVLEDVAAWRKLIVATPDEEFSDLLETSITKSKAVYEFIDWSEKDGPEIVRAT